MPYSATLKAVGGDGVYHWSAEGFPDGLSIDPATGVISGTINVTGVVTFPAQFVIFATVTDGESPPQKLQDPLRPLCLRRPATVALITR